jgi:hypothetical protein
MATAAQVTANRANAQLSTGPRTEEGKQASAANSVSTGLTSATIFVRPEEAETFGQFDAALLAEFQPEGVNQDHLYTLILHAAWNIRRCYTLEAQIQNEAIAQGLPDALLDDTLSLKLDRIYRYKKMHESSYRRAVVELRRLQTEEVWRRENQELLDESVLINSGAVMTGLRMRSTREAAHDVSRLERQIHEYINAPLPRG